MPPPWSRHGILALLFSGAWLFAAVTPASADDQPSLEYQVKATFLLNFTKYVEWPATAFSGPEAPFSMCLLGKDPFGHLIDDLVEGEEVQGHKLVIRRISQTPPQSCQALYIYAPPEEAAKIAAAAGPGVLTVAEGGLFVRDGGMIGFVLDNQRVRFDINQSAAERAGLKLSSRLLRVAKAVQR